MYKQEEESNDATKEEEELTYHEQVDAFTNDIEALIHRYAMEFDLTRETMIGCLECQKVILADPMIIDLGSEMIDDED